MKMFSPFINIFKCYEQILALSIEGELAIPDVSGQDRQIVNLRSCFVMCIFQIKIWISTLR